MTSRDAAIIKRIIEKIQTPGVPHWSLEQIQAEMNFSRALGLSDSQKQTIAFIVYKCPAPETIEIIYLACAQAFQRRGLMTELFIEFLQKIKLGAVGPTDVWLDVHEQNHAAIVFYEKFGFLRAGRRDNYYSDHGAAILYSLKI